MVRIKSLLFAALTLLAPACSVQVDYSGTSFSCETSSECPAGQSCEAQLCVANNSEGAPDAGEQLEADAAPQPEPDASVVQRLSLQGPDVTEDVSLASDRPAENLGSQTSNEADANPLKQSLMRFDLSELPENATVVGARLHLLYFDPIEEGQFEVFVVNEDWDEDSATFTQSSTGVPWQEAPSSTPSGSPVFILAPRSAGPVKIELPIGLIEEWKSGPNQGLRFTAKSIAGRGGQFRSSEATSASEAPRLEIDFVVP